MPLSLAGTPQKSYGARKQRDRKRNAESSATGWGVKAYLIIQVASSAEESCAASAADQACPTRPGGAEPEQFHSPVRTMSRFCNFCNSAVAKSLRRCMALLRAHTDGRARFHMGVGHDSLRTQKASDAPTDTRSPSAAGSLAGGERGTDVSALSSKPRSRPCSTRGSTN
jgi:hypothetical protein